MDAQRRKPLTPASRTALGCNLVQRRQHEAALGKARVRQDQIGAAQTAVTEK